jgi:hypothetical protein
MQWADWKTFQTVANEETQPQVLQWEKFHCHPINLNFIKMWLSSHFSILNSLVGNHQGAISFCELFQLILYYITFKLLKMEYFLSRRSARRNKTGNLRQSKMIFGVEMFFFRDSISCSSSSNFPYGIVCCPLFLFTSSQSEPHQKGWDKNFFFCFHL